MISEKVEFIIKVFCIIIIITLNVLVYVHGKDLSCDKCKIHFQSEKTIYKNVYDSPLQNLYINISLIYNDFLNNKCYIEWDKDSQGFRVNDVTKIK
jgi:hypothetical protein